MFRKLFASQLIVLTLLFFSVKTTKASLLTISSNGTASWNVLAFETDLAYIKPNNSSLQLKKVASESNLAANSSIILKAVDNTTSLTVIDDSGKRQADVTNITGDIVEIEQITSPQTIKISNSSSNGFTISNQGISATTNSPIQIDPGNKEISVQTSSGFQYLSILPNEAVAGVFKANLINKLSPDVILTLSENTQGNLNYLLSGSKIFEIFKIFELEIPVQATVSASTGQIVEINQPIWYSLLGFLLT